MGKSDLQLDLSVRHLLVKGVNVSPERDEGRVSHRSAVARVSQSCVKVKDWSDSRNKRGEFAAKE